MATFELYRAPPSSGKKYKVIISMYGARHSVMFGAAGYSDYTQHKDPARKQRYIDRHRAREHWSSAGLYTAGFWSRWLLWNKPSLLASAHDIERRFGLRYVGLHDAHHERD